MSRLKNFTTPIRDTLLRPGYKPAALTNHAPVTGSECTASRCAPAPLEGVIDFELRVSSGEAKVRSFLNMDQIPLLVSVALLRDFPERGLTRGQMGTVVEYLGAGADQAVLVEFADEEGQTCAMADLKPDQLAILHRGSRAA